MPSKRRRIVCHTCICQTSNRWWPEILESMFQGKSWRWNMSTTMKLWGRGARLPYINFSLTPHSLSLLNRSDKSLQEGAGIPTLFNSLKVSWNPKFLCSLLFLLVSNRNKGTANIPKQSCSSECWPTKLVALWGVTGLPGVVCFAFSVTAHLCSAPVWWLSHKCRTAHRPTYWNDFSLSGLGDLTQRLSEIDFQVPVSHTFIIIPITFVLWIRSTFLRM